MPKIECANCGDAVETSENISLKRLITEADEFFSKHRSEKTAHNGSNVVCSPDNIFLRTYPLCS